MRKFILALGAVATLASTATVATTANAYTSRCESRAHDKKVGGTVIGGVLGALAGNAISHGGGGAVIGGLAGAAVGNNLSRTHCPSGYVQRAYDDRYYDAGRGTYRPGYNASRCGWRDESYRDDRGRMATRQVQVCR